MAKFLETPARRYQKELGDIVRTAVRKGASVVQGLLLAGLRLMREAQLLTPVDTSALKSSFFVTIERDLDAKSEEMFAASEEVRKKVSARQAKMSGRKLASIKARQREAWQQRMKEHG